MNYSDKGVNELEKQMKAMYDYMEKLSEEWNQTKEIIENKERE